MSIKEINKEFDGIRHSYSIILEMEEGPVNKGSSGNIATSRDFNHI